ncbi:tetratricopeptide repeat protein [Streptomyces sp. HMX87]|uniref:tetratricopeptide repeat protein n=1 Tax=Streptomyces sp. HMX87 TaxID=3390849 RepID=UPI003A8AA541
MSCTPHLPPSAPPEPPGPPGADPVAVAVGNASLLGVGYLLLGRLGLFWAAAAVTVSLVWTTASVAEAWCEVVVLLWWAAVVSHGWRLARRSPAAPRHGQRLRAVALTLTVLVTVGALRFEAHLIENEVAEARADGDCTAVTEAQDRVLGFSHRLVAAPLAARGDRVVEVCDRLQMATGELSRGLDADLDALDAGFRRLGSVLADPANDKLADVILKDFLRRLPTTDACETVRIADWLRDRETDHRTLAAAPATAARITPEALMECGDDLFDEGRWPDARARYQRLVDDHPDDDRVGTARKGIRKTVLAVQLDHVKGLLGGPAGTDGGYCARPAKYEGAPARREGANPAVFVGTPDYTEKLPGGWRTTDPAKASLIVCAEETGRGAAVETCAYRDHEQRIRNITFYKIGVRVKAYELRTGKRVTDRTVQLGGASCPGIITYYGSPPSYEYVEPAASDIRRAFGPVVGR